MKQRILITGGAGSLGKAFVRLLHQDHELVVIDNNEWAVAQLSHEFPDVKVILGDFTEWRYNVEPIDVLIHCAAYKHVDLCEKNPKAAIKNNITKTEELFDEAYKYNVEILYISTDKAVEPCSVYGFTKALAERLAKNRGATVARLGNILGSSGSVIPTWEQSIDHQQAIPITDERMARYWIEDFEAVNQVWDQFKAGKGLIIPQMQEIRLMDLLAEVLKRHGYENPDDYGPGVEKIGMRPGEKLQEKLRWDDEL